MALATLVYENEVSDAEWETRCDLAALYRIFHNMRMTDLVYTHLSARVPDEPNCFLMNQYGEMFDEVTASSLVKDEPRRRDGWPARRVQLRGLHNPQRLLLSARGRGCGHPPPYQGKHRRRLGQGRPDPDEPAFALCHR